MPEPSQSRPAEMRKLPNGTGPALLQLTASDAWETQHTYYDLCPVSDDGRSIVASSLPVGAELQPFGHDTLASPRGRVCVIDTGDFSIRQVAGEALYMRHGGAFCMWRPGRREVLYRRDAEHTALLDVDTGAERLLPGRVRQLSPDGQLAAVPTRTRHGGGQGAGVGVMPLETGEIREVVLREQLYDLTPNRDRFGPGDMTLGNTKWHPDGRHILVTCWIYPRPEARRSLYVITRDGSEIRWLTHFGHHHSWAPDGQAVLFNDLLERPDGRREPRMMLIDFDGSNRRTAFDQPVGSHPLMHPDGRRIVDADAEGVWQARLEENRLERLVEFGAAFRRDHHGIHPHPVWTRDGRGVLYNSAETGHSELYYLPEVN